MSPIIKTEGEDEHSERADSLTPTPNPSPSPTTSCNNTTNIITPAKKLSKARKSSSNSKRSRTRGRSIADDSEDRRYPCEETGCGKVFKRSEHLKRHHRSIHARDKPYRCPYQACSKRFSRSDNLNQHMRVHRDSKTRSDTSR
ncbi:hypothetical protein BCR43DRAFT_433507 [Syncephalastrum racemosum]|uniref:C2H2-type domain-containing protein n=1 Tax=Syncephalastrum racemosum TaxID=13706 RepID=A0A1X2HR05_SYNRA|nr:hypothetical protein BCR43DRAFT_433507 [Syncephalastrum racemosum]